jgi:uncharacterized membrane protein
LAGSKQREPEGAIVNATAAAATRSQSRLWIIAILGALGLFALYFIVRSALPYFNLSREHYGPYFWPRRWMLVLHIAGGITALTAGLVQLWLGLTNRVARLHRALGKVYVGVILVGSIAGFYLALTIPRNVPYASGLFFLCVAWVATTAMALIAIRRRNILQHREWMMRSYAVTFAFVTFRFGVDLLTSQGVTGSEAQGTMAWACWALPLLLLEPMLQLRKVRGR